MRTRIATGCLGILLGLGVAAANERFPALSINAIYLELGRGESARAAQSASELLAQTPATAAHRVGILQAQLDICVERREINKSPCAQLLERIDAMHEGLGSVLHTNRVIAQYLERGEAQVALTIAQEALKNASAEELPELNILVARAAAQVPGQGKLAQEQAELSLAYWQTLDTVRARWYEGEIYYIIANVYITNGNQEAALAELEKGSHIAIAAFGPTGAGRFMLDADRAGVLASMGRQKQALEIRESLLLAARSRYGAESFEVAKAEGLLGANFQEIGDYAAARTHYERAQALIASNPQAEPLERGLIAANYANLLQEQGEEQHALEQYRHALALWGDGETTMHARSIVSANMGNTEFRLRNYAAAIADFERALALREKSDGKSSPGLAFALEGLGSSSLALQQFSAAEGYYRRALELRSNAFGPDHPMIAPLNFGLALALWGKGNDAEAFAIAVDVAQRQQTLLRVFAADFSERQSIAYREVLMPATALATTLAARRGDSQSVATAWRLAMVERGLVARTQAHLLAEARAKTNPQMAATFAAWRAANSALGEAWLERKVDRSHILQLQSKAEQAEHALWVHSGQASMAVTTSEAELGAIFKAVPADAVLIAFSEGLAPDPGRLLVAGGKLAPEDWYAFTLGTDKQPKLRRVGDIRSIAAQARAWYGDLRNPTSNLTQLRESGLVLRKALFGDDVTSATKRIFIVPEGDLYRLSFAALPNADHGYLIESGLRVHTLAHESDMSVSAAVHAFAGNVLLAGAPDFPVSATAALASRSLCMQAARDGFTAIPNAGRELEDLHALLSAVSAQGEVRLVEGAAATKQSVLEALPHATIAHLATHGFSMDASCSEIAAGRGVTIQAELPASQGGDPGPVGVSGLAFSGSSVAAVESPVGIVTAGELATLDLSGLSWIALSSCDSGLGSVGRNEGVFGMRRALRLAGARTVIMSLWQVDDAATADLMGTLYRRRFVEDRDVPESMADAMVSVIEARRAARLPDHPYYWAAFIAEGGWR